MRKTQFGSYADKTTQSDTSVDFEKEVKAKSLETIEGDIEMNGNKVINMAEPVADSDGATKLYVDANASVGGETYIDTEVSSAQLLDLFNTPVELIPQPIDGSLSYPSKVYIKYIFNTTPYRQAGSVSINVRTSAYTDEVLGETFGSYTFSSGADYQRLTQIVQVGELDAFSTELYTPSALTEGDGTIKVRVYYSVIETAF